MASKVLVGMIPPEAEHILKSYLTHFLPDAEIEPLKSVGIKGTMKLKAVRADVIMVILDESLYSACVGTVDDILKLDKVHKYLNDDGLTQYLISRFGKLDGGVTSNSTPTESTLSSGYQTITEDEQPMTVATSNVAEPIETNDKSDAKIVELQDKLAQSEMLVKNLTAQLKDSQNESDMVQLIDRIKDLEQALSEKDAEIQQLGSGIAVSTEGSGQLDADTATLRAELKQLREDCADLTFQRNKAESEKTFLQSEIDRVMSETADLRASRDKLEEVTKSLAEMTEKCAALESANSDANVLQSKIDEQTAALSDLDTIKADLNQKELDIQNLQVDLDAKTKKVEDLTVKLNDLSSLIDEKDIELQKKNDEITALQTAKEESDKQIGALNDQISELQANLNKLTVSLEQKSNEIATLEQENTDTMNKLEADTKLQDVLADSKKTVQELQNTVNDLNTQIAIQEGKLTAYENRNAQLMADKEKNAEILAQAIKEKEDLSLQVSELTKKAAQAEGSVQSSDYTELQNTNKKLENEIAQLKANLVDSQSGSEAVTQLNNELLEERRKNARISAELEVYRNGGDILAESDNLVEVNKLKKEIEELKEELNNKNESSADISSAELEELKQKCADMEVELLDKDNILDEYQNGIFGQLANVAMPKVAYDIKAIVPEKLTSKCVVVASGSVESNLALYQNLKRTCTTENNKNYIIVDLVTDTSIDMAFGITNIQSPIKWLTGEQPYQAFLADTKFRNVKVLSTGLAYINDLSLLVVDWVSRITELQKQADVVIFNVGCLNNFVAKILFSSFTRIMQGHIVVKATPINLRTIILTLTGFTDKRSLSNVLVSCVNFDTGSSKALYQKLVSKCQSQILKDADILRF